MSNMPLNTTPCRSTCNTEEVVFKGIMLRMLKGGSLVLYRKVPFLYNHVLKIGRHDAQDIYLTLFYPLGVK